MSNGSSEEFEVRSAFFLFIEANLFGQTIDPESIRSEELRKLAIAFQSNVERIRQMTRVPQVMAYAATEYMLFFSQAVFNVIGKPVLDDTDMVHTRAVQVELRDTVSALSGNPRPNVTDWCTTQVLNHHKYNYIYQHNPAGILALVGSQVIGAWTAFDTLATDTWKTVVNLCPDRAAKAYKDRQFSMTRLQQHKFNWQGRVSELLAKGMNLSSFKEIKKEFKKLIPELEDLHSQLESLKVVSDIRNILVHSAGVADENFVSRYEWNGLEAGKPLPLDGPIVRDLTDRVIHAGNHLLKSVDDLLASPVAPASTSPPHNSQ